MKITTILLTPFNFIFSMFFSLIRTIIWFFYVSKNNSFFGIQGPSIDPSAIISKALILLSSLGLFLLVPFVHSFYRIFKILQKINKSAQFVCFLSYLPEILIEGFSFFGHDQYENIILNKPINRSKIYSISKENMKLENFDLAIKGFESILKVQDYSDYKKTKKYMHYCIQESNYRLGLRFYENKDYDNAYAHLSGRASHTYKDSSKIIDLIHQEFKKTSESIINAFEEMKYDQVINYFKENRNLLKLKDVISDKIKKFDFTKMEKDCIEIIKQYQVGTELFNAGNYTDASVRFERCISTQFQNKRINLLGYKDSVNLYEKCKEFIRIETPKINKLHLGKHKFEIGEYEIAYEIFLSVKDFKDANKYLAEIEKVLRINKEIDDAINKENYELAQNIIDNITQFNKTFFNKKLMLIEKKIIESKKVLHKNLRDLLIKYYNDIKIIESAKETINNLQFPEALLILSQVEAVQLSNKVWNEVLMKLIFQLNQKKFDQDFDYILATEKRLKLKVKANQKALFLNNYTLDEVSDNALINKLRLDTKPFNFNGLDGYVYKDELYILKSYSYGRYSKNNFYRVTIPITNLELKELFRVAKFKCRLYDQAIATFLEDDYDSFLLLSESIFNYKDVPELRTEALRKINEYNNAVSLLNSHRYDEALTYFTNLGQIRNSLTLKIELEKMSKYYLDIKRNFNNENYLMVFQKLIETYSFSEKKSEEFFSFDIFQYQDIKEILITAEMKLLNSLNLAYLSKKFDEVVETLKSINFITNDKNEIEINLQKKHPSVYELAMKNISGINKYNQAKEFILRGEYQDAIAYFQTIIGYKDSREKLTWCFQMLQFKNYLQFFFREFCGILQEDLVSLTFEERYQLAIVKDKVERIMNKDASGKLMERTWRNVIFYNLNQQEIKDYSTKDFSKIASNIFDELKSKHGYLFVRSYVYIILVSQNEPINISKSDYHLFYFNTNYRFGPVHTRNDIFNNVEYSFVVQDINSELKTMKDKNMDSLDCARAYNGQLPLYDATKQKIKSLYEKIEKHEISRFLIEGPARSGKTIIAMQLLHQFPQAVFLLMNYYFYLALKDAFAVLGIPFPSSRIFHHDLSKQRESGCAIQRGTRSNGWKKSFKLSLDFVIIDEAQRLSNLESQTGYTGIVFPGFAELDILVRDSRISVFLGDNYQRINPKYDKGFEEIRSILNQASKNFISYRFNETIGIPVNLVNSFKFILDSQSQNIDSLGNHQVRLFNQISDFIADFKANPTYSKHYVTLPDYSLPPSLNLQGITIYPVELRYSDYPFFLNSETLNRYVHSTYEVISRELQSLYLVIPDSITYNENEGIFDSANKLSKEYLFNHLYVNMTRATQKLVIYTGNQSLFEYLKNRIAKVTDHQFKDEWKNYSVEEQKLNFVSNFSDKSYSSSLKAVLLKHGFTGFIHATDLNNVEKILKSGYLYSRDSANDTFKDIADQNIIYRTSSFVKSNVRFYYASGTPTLYHFSNKNSHLVILEFIYELVEKFECYFTDGNAASNYTLITGDVKEALDFNWQMIFSRGPFNEIERREIIRRRNAEFLVNADVPIKTYLKSIIFKEEIDLEKIANNFPEYKLLCRVDKSKF